MVSEALDVNSLSRRRGERVTTNMTDENAVKNNKKFFLLPVTKTLRLGQKKKIDAKAIRKIARSTPLVALYMTINNPTAIPSHSINLDG